MQLIELKLRRNWVFINNNKQSECGQNGFVVHNMILDPGRKAFGGVWPQLVYVFLLLVFAEFPNQTALV